MSKEEVTDGYLSILIETIHAMIYTDRVCSIQQSKSILQQFHDSIPILSSEFLLCVRPALDRLMEGLRQKYPNEFSEHYCAKILEGME
jgi:hypothetical protein